jgi:hypothetical protein
MLLQIETSFFHVQYDTIYCSYNMLKSKYIQYLVCSFRLEHRFASLHINTI